MNTENNNDIGDVDIDIEDLAKFSEEMNNDNNDNNVTPPPKLVTRKNLEWYYDKVFPFKQFFKWLGLGDFDLFERREFSFTLENDIYVRFQSYKNDEEFKKEVMRGIPLKIDIGAVYNTQPRYHNSIAVSDSKSFTPVQKEMIFDIDMTDYDDVRTCCKETKICDKCWKFMIIAYKILNAILSEDFGFENTQYIFSGRRGIHCWVSDARARNLTNEGRSAIANYIKFKTANLNTGVRSYLKEPVHPSLE